MLHADAPQPGMEDTLTGRRCLLGLYARQSLLLPLSPGSEHGCAAALEAQGPIRQGSVGSAWAWKHRCRCNRCRLLRLGWSRQKACCALVACHT